MKINAKCFALIGLIGLDSKDIFLSCYKWSLFELNALSDLLKLITNQE